MMKSVDLKQPMKYRVLRWALLAILLVVLLVTIYPVVWMVLTSFKTKREITMNSMFSLPASLNTTGYIEAWTSGKMSVFLVNSARISIISLVLILFVCIPSAFAMSKMIWKFKNVAVAYITLGVMIPVQVCLLPIFQMYKGMSLLNTHTGLILVEISANITVTNLLFISFFHGLPNDIMEAAVVDGCSIYGMLFRVIMPLMRNVILTVLTVAFLNCWNELIFSQTLLSSTNLKTVQTGLLMFDDAHGSKNWSAVFAAMTISVLPTLVIYSVLSKYMIQGLTAGSVKG